MKPVCFHAGGPRITVLGIGNTLMGDDGVGVAVVEGLDIPVLSPNVRVVVGATAGMRLLSYFLDSDLVIVVDALTTQAAAGTVFRFHPDDIDMMGVLANDTHGMGISYLLTSARLMGANPDVVVYGVQVGDVRPSDRQLTPPVAAATMKVRQLVMEEISRRSNEETRGLG
jgi:hydrogenase maturation protease